MRGIELFLRSRRAGWVLLGIVGSAALAGLLLVMTTDYYAVRTLMILAPLIPAVLLGVSTRSSFGEIEYTGSRRLIPLRMIHLGGLLTCAALAFGLVNLLESDPAFRWTLLRNLAAYAGLAFIGARLFGPSFASTFAWTLPLAYAALVWFVEVDTRWAWSSTLSPVSSAVVIAMALIGLGLTLVLTAGADRRGDEGDVV